MPAFYKSSTPLADVLNFVSQLETRADTVARYGQHDIDESIWRLEPYVLEEVQSQGKQVKDWPSVTLNGPRTFWNVCRHALTTADPRFRIELPPLTAEPQQPMIPMGVTEKERRGYWESFEEQQKADALEETSVHEQFAYGLWQMVDEARVVNDLRPFKSDMAWYACIRGGIYGRMWYNPDSRFPFDAKLWDPRTCVHEVGAEGLSFVAHHYWTPFYDVLDRYGVDDKTYAKLKGEVTADAYGNVEVYDCWWMEQDKCYNAVYSGGCELREAMEMPKLDHLPVFVIRSFGPDIEGAYDRRDKERRTQDAWESIYTANRQTYPLLNRIATLYALYLRNNAIGPFQGNKTLTADQLAAIFKPFGYAGTDDEGGINIRPIGTAQMAGEVKEFFAQLQGTEQRGSVPYSVYGQLNFELSGFAINQLRGGVGIVVDEAARAMESMYQLMTDEAVQQFKARGKKLTIRGRDKRDQRFLTDLGRTQLRSKYYMEVEIEPSLPVDRLQEAQIAQAWAGIGIDPITIMDEVLHIKDPRQVAERMVLWGILKQESAARAQPQMGDDRPEFNPDGRVLPEAFNGNPPVTPMASTGMSPPGGNGYGP